MGLLTKFSLDAKWASSLRFKDYRLLFYATTISSIGMGMERVSIGWLVFDMTDSVFMVGVSGAVSMAPFFFFGIVSGSLADWVDRRSFVRHLTYGTGIVSGLMAVVLLSEVAQVWHVMGLALLTGCMWAFLMTVRQAYTYDLVGPNHALNGMALSSVAMSLGGIVGSMLSGFVISELGIGTQYLFVMGSYILAGTMLLWTKQIRRAFSSKSDSLFENLLSYGRLLRDNRTLSTLMLMTALIEIFGFSHQTLLPVIAKDDLNVGAIGLGLMIGVRQSGGVIGVMLLANLGNFRRKGLLLFVLSSFFGLGLMSFSVMSSLGLFLVMLAFVNGCAMSVDALNRTLMQDNVADNQRGRAMGSYVFSIGTAPLGHVGVGALSTWLGTSGALLVNGGILACVGLAAAISLPKIRRLP